MLKKIGTVAVGVAGGLFMLTGMASAQGEPAGDYPDGAHHLHGGHNNLVHVGDTSLGNGSLNNVGQCIAVPKPQVPVAVNGIGAAVATAAQDIKPPVVLPEINVLGGHNGDSVTTTSVIDQTGNNNCTGGSGNGAGSGTGHGSGDGAAAGSGDSSAGDGAGIFNGW
ncbi:hypothetical protein [Actinokineospora sp.]|uniref:hypothetical protein n=1 Tax=Actinokineospora sp. TaxID=1872133 RepID=UPI003D6B602D